MPPENNSMSLLDGAIFMQNGEKLCDVTEIPEFVDTELLEADPDNFVISAHFPESLEFSITLTKQQVKRIVRFMERETNRVNRAVRRYKRFKERMRRKRLKEGGFNRCS